MAGRGEMNYNLVELFAGIGGFRLGFENKTECVWANDIDKHACQVYRYRFGEICEQDIRTVEPADVPDCDIITFGFPCQDLSIAGKRGGLQSSRSGLFFEAMRIIRAKMPRYIIFENVKGLFSSNGGKDFVAILGEIANAGYDGQWQLLNTRWFLPQNRERIYFIGHIRGQTRPEIFPIRESNETCQKDTESERRNRLEGSCSQCIRGGARQRYDGETLIQVAQIGEKDNMGQRVYSTNGDSCSIRSQGGGQGAKTGLYESNNAIRRLTPIECERLQGFPDDFTKHGIDDKGNKVNISDTQRYKMLGNAISVPVVRHIAEKLL